MKRVQMISQKAFLTLAGVLASVTLFAACGSGGFGDGSRIYGNLSMGGGGGAARTSMLVQDSEPLTGYVVEVRDVDGNVVASAVVDGDGNFSISGVSEGDYTLVVIDPDTGEEVVDVNITVLEGDDAKINGEFSGGSVSWDISFEADDSSLNETQQERAENLAELTDMSASEILAMRESGMGWGQIAHELGIHPGHLGMGHKDGWEPKKGGKTKKDVKGKGKGKGNSGGKGK